MPKPPQPPTRLSLPEEVTKVLKKEDNWPVKCRIRVYEESAMCDVWILKCSKGVTSALLWGQMHREVADLLAIKLGIKPEYEIRPYPFTSLILSPPID